MEANKIDALAQVMTKNNLTELTIKEEGVEISLKRQPDGVPVSVAPRADNPVSPEAPPQQPKEKPQGFDNLYEIKSPLAGVFYSAPSPESPPFVKIGDKVKKGDVLCIIEAMKLMNEITAEQDGEIVDISADNEQIVEFGQTLFTLL